MKHINRPGDNTRQAFANHPESFPWLRDIAFVHMAWDNALDPHSKCVPTVSRALLPKISTLVCLKTENLGSSLKYLPHRSIVGPTVLKQM